MAIADMIPAMDDQGLNNLRGNAERLARSGTPKQRADADRLLPLIVSEMETRKAAKPTKAKVARPKKAPAPKKARRAAETEVEEEAEED